MTRDWGLTEARMCKALDEWGQGLNEGKLVLRHTPLGVIPHLREHLLHVGIGTNGFASHLREGCNEPVAGGVLISGGQQSW